MIKGIFCGDLHIGLRVEDLDRTPEVLEALDFIVDTAIEEKVDFVEIGGDVFDNNLPTPDQIAEFMSRLNRLEEAEILTLVLGGNHEAVVAPDRYWALTPLEEVGYEYVKFFKVPQTYMHKFSDQTIHFMMMPHVGRHYAKSKGFENPQEYIEDWARDVLKGMGKTKPIVCSHYNVFAAKAGTEATMLRQSDLQLPNWIANDKRVKYIVNHHIHTPQKFKKVWIPGSIICTDFGDAQDNKGFLLTTYKDRKWTMKRVKTPQSPLNEYELDFMETPKKKWMSQVKQCAEHCTADAIVKLRILIEEERLPELDEKAMRKAFEGKCRYVKSVHKHVTRKKNVRNPEQKATLSPLQAVEIYLTDRKPEGRDRKLALAKALINDEAEYMTHQESFENPEFAEEETDELIKNSLAEDNFDQLQV